MRAGFVYLNSRRRVLEGVAAGTEPDSTLYGANHLPEHGVEVLLHEPLLTRRELPSPLARAAWSLRELTVPFELRGCDVLVTPLGAGGLGASARLRRLPVVIVNFGLNLIWARAGASRRRLLRASLAAAARVVCLGESQRGELLELTRLPPEQVTTLLVAVDDRFFSPEPPPDTKERPLVLSVGKDLARDFETLASAVAPLDVDVELVALPRNIEGVDLPPNARVRSGIPSTRLRRLYASADCVLVVQRPDAYPYGSEGGGLTALLEAMAMGKAVVATERRILRDYVDDGVDALLVPPGDPAALREALERLLAEPELAHRLGSAARARVERAHTTRGFAAQLVPLLREAVYARKHT
jgi:glycosyltransferase involved in cell wall biosynthesis